MERRFLTSNTKSKKNEGEGVVVQDSIVGDATKVGLASKIKNIEGKLIGKGGNLRKPVRSDLMDTRDGTDESASGMSMDKSNTQEDNLHVYVGGPPQKYILKKTTAMGKVTGQQDGDTPNEGVAKDSNGTANGSNVEVAAKDSNDGVTESKAANNFDCVLSQIAMEKVSKDYEDWKVEVTKVPVWVKLHSVHVLAYSDDGLSLIATQIVSADSVLKNEVTMGIPNEKGDGYIKEVIRVEYEWKPPQPNHMKDQGDGFVEVRNRKNKGKKWDTSRFISGIRLSKPKSNFYWKQKKGEGSMAAPVATTFDVLNSVEDDVIGPSDKRTVQEEGSNFQNPNGSDAIGSGNSKMVDDKVQEEDSLWSRFQRAKKVSNSKSNDLEDESDEDEVYGPNDDYTTPGGRGFSMEDDDLDCYDEYEH
ncbi:hypothetical protein Tco_1370645 [Tanacetum coccineum]